MFLDKSDRKYEGSTAGAEGGGRTLTFGVKNPVAKLKGKAVYHRKDDILRGGKPTVQNGYNWGK